MFLNVSSLLDDGNIEFFWIICLLFGLALIPNAYTFSYLFKSTSAVLIFYTMISLLTALIAPMILMQLTFAGEEFEF